MEDREVIREFLAESYENLSRLDGELVELEKHPKDAALLGSIFRAIHTIKGTCGFLSFSTLERITHQAESILSQLRDGERELSPSLVSLILETVDTIRKVLGSIETSEVEGPDQFEELTGRLRIAAQLTDVPQSQSGPGPPGPDSTRDPPAELLEDNGADEFSGKHVDEATRSSVADSNIRVGVGLLDKLMDLVGELVLTRNQIVQLSQEREDAALNATFNRLNRITTELQESVMKTRMQPIGTMWNNLPRVVRDISVALGKQIRLEMDGAGTELDRTVIEAIRDPLVHLVRNACGHGIELPDARVRAGKKPLGRLTLRAYHEGGQVNIEIGDDGAGVDIARVKKKAVETGLLRPEQVEKLSERETLNLIFQPGFSTAQTVTTLSGRGIGMDVVKAHIEKIGGVVELFSRPGEGATIRIRIPLTLAIIPGLVIASGGERFVIPQVSLLELIRLEGDSAEKHIEHVHGTPVYRRRGSLLPLAYLNQVLGLKSADGDGTVSIVVVQAADRQLGLVVDGINDTQEIVVKPLGGQFKDFTVYAGATIMGDGRVALILDVLGIGRRSGVITESREQTRAAERKKQPELELQRLLLFRAGSFERLAVPLSLVARLEEFPQSAIERAGGGQVVQYRNGILPLITLRNVLEPGEPSAKPAPDPVPVVVLDDGDRSVGMVVDEILDVAEDEITVRRKSTRKGLLGSAIAGQRVTDFVDLNEVMQAAAETWFQGANGPANGRRILVAEASAFSRGLIRGGLDMAGYGVVEAGNLSEAIQGLERQPVDAVVAALDLPPNGMSALVAAMRLRPEWEAIPVLALAESAEQVRARAGQTTGFQDCQLKFDREAMLRSLARLASALAPAAAPPVDLPEEARVGKERR